MLQKSKQKKNTYVSNSPPRYMALTCSPRGEKLLLHRASQDLRVRPGKHGRTGDLPKTRICIYIYIHIYIYIPKDPDMSSESGINPTILLWGWDWDHQTYEFSGRVWILREKNTLRVQPPFFSPVGCNEFRHVLLRKGGLHYPRGSTILPKWWPCRLPG